MDFSRLDTLLPQAALGKYPDLPQLAQNLLEAKFSASCCWHRPPTTILQPILPPRTAAVMIPA